MPLVSSGVEHGNLRELALARMKDLGTQVNHNVFKLMFLSFMTTTLLGLVALSYAASLRFLSSETQELWLIAVA